MKQKTLHQGPHLLGAILKREREESGVSVREIARRSSISAGQISRIESGETERPSEETIRALARALNADPVPLLFLADRIDEGEALHHLAMMSVHLGDLRDMADEAFERLSKEIGYDSEVWDDPKRSAAELFSASRLLTSAFWGGQEWLEESTYAGARELLGAWEGLTPERQKLVRAFVADQEVLSELDRMPNPRGRYRMRVQLELREGDGGK